MNENYLVIIQARMTSSRLPEKVLALISDEYNCLELMIHRLGNKFKNIYIATTINKEDDPIVVFCEKRNIKYYRGSEQNVLSRFEHIINDNSFDNIIRLTADCPLIDPNLISMGIQYYEGINVENKIVGISVDNNFPRGFDFEIFSRSLFELSAVNPSPASIEHVTQGMYVEGVYDQVIHKIKCPIKGASKLRFTVDTPEDLELIRVLEKKHIVSNKKWDEIINIVKNDQSLISINSNINQKDVKDLEVPKS